MNTAKEMLPFKSVAAALLFSVILGPIGLLYATFWGGFFMCFLGLVLLTGHYVFLTMVYWMSCCIWAVGSVEKFNRRLLIKQS